MCSLRQLLGTGVMHTDPHGGNLLKAEGSVTKTHGVLCVAFDDADCYGRLESHPCLEVVVSCFRHLLNPVRLKHVGDNLALFFLTWAVL